MHPARILSVRDVTRRVRRLVLRLEPTWGSPASANLRFPEKSFDFRPGQWADFALPHPDSPIGGYSFVSSPHDLPFVEFLVQKEGERHRDAPAEVHPAGSAAPEQDHYKKTMTSWIHSGACAPGTLVGIRAGGKFLWGAEKRSVRRRVFIAAGIGVTPFLSWLRTYTPLHEADHSESILLSGTPVSSTTTSTTHLFYVLRDRREALLSAGTGGRVSATPGVSFRMFETGKEGRRPSVADVFNYISEIHSQRQGEGVGPEKAMLMQDANFYLCGPPTFADDFARQLKAARLEFGAGGSEQELENRIAYERWW